MANFRLRHLRVFLSSSSSDRPIARELFRKLAGEGWMDVWFDEERLLPGQDWDYEVEKALDDSDVLIAALAIRSASEEGPVEREQRLVLELALERPKDTITIIPVRLDDCKLPRYLRSGQPTIDYFPLDNRYQAYERLLSILRSHAETLGKGPTPLSATRNVHQEAKGDPSQPRHSIEKQKKPDITPEQSAAAEELRKIKAIFFGESTRREAPLMNTSDGVRTSNQVFISYSRKDVDFANKVHNDLKRYQLRTWIDQVGIRAGHDWPDRIANAIMESQVVLAIVSLSALESDWVKRELYFADQHRKLILPLIYKNCIFPPWFDLRFGNIQRADFTKGKYERNLQSLLSSLEEMLNR